MLNDYERNVCLHPGVGQHSAPLLGELSGVRTPMREWAGTCKGVSWAFPKVPVMCQLGSLLLILHLLSRCQGAQWSCLERPALRGQFSSRRI